MTDEEEKDTSLAEISDAMALTENPAVRKRTQDVIGVLSKPEAPQRFTSLKKKYSIAYAKILYMMEDIAAMEDWETNGGDYMPPDFPKELVYPDLNLKTSEDSLLIKVMRSISHIVEGKPSGGRLGFFGHRKD